MACYTPTTSTRLSYIMYRSLQIVAEFETEDQGLFIKFVTSVSKPPLLGFHYLRPPFTIRYVSVDVTDQEEEGFSFKHLFMGPTQKTARLPTAATCFNTLKLPAYNKKSTLREKVRTCNSVCSFDARS